MDDMSQLSKFKIAAIIQIISLQKKKSLNCIFLKMVILSGSGKLIEICACLNLEVLSVPEGLVHSIRILVAPAVVLARRWRRC